MFEKASIAAAKDWRYDMPETINGKPIGTTAMVPIVYLVLHGWYSAASRRQMERFMPGPMHPAPWMNEHGCG